MVKLVMDPADVPLHAAKMFLYISGEDQKSAAYFIADRLFELFAVVFFITRLIMYGYVVFVAAECPLTQVRKQSAVACDDGVNP